MMEIASKGQCCEVSSEPNQTGVRNQSLQDLVKTLSDKKILDEDSYTEELEKIIQRDFFPDLLKLKAQTDYLEALENNDVAKLHEIQMKYLPRISGRPGSTLSAVYNTPSTFETPLIDRDSPPPREQPECLQEETEEQQLLENNNKDSKGKMSLDHFLSKCTSEDNASFKVIMEQAAEQHKLRYPWLYKDEDDEKQKVSDLLALPSIEKQAIPGRPSAAVVTWAYKNKNALMYVPDGAELTADEKVQNEKREEVVYDNTHFHSAPFNEVANKAAIAEAASVQAKMKEGKVGIDGKEILPQESPQVNGYSFVATPSPAPGVEDSPLMTWGEIEGTPFRLDGSDTPLPHNPGGPQFKIPELPARERIALSLADKVAKQHRTKKQEALRRVQSGLFSPSPRFGSGTPKTPLEQLSSMSPAAQKLARAKLGIHRGTDRALRASYSPSPVITPHSDRTPTATRTPPVTPSNSEHVLKKRAGDTPISLTDNLLHLPKRNKAKDFF